MPNYVLRFDRAAKRILEIVEFPDSERKAAISCSVEHTEFPGVDVEHSMVMAPDFEAFRSAQLSAFLTHEVEHGSVDVPVRKADRAD